MSSVLIVGGGKLGYHLAASLRSAGYAVTVLDRDPEACGRIARELDAVAVLGDGTEVSAMGDADAGRADFIVAATGADEDNLAVCRIAKAVHRCPRVIARIIDPRNEGLYRLAGADAVINPTAMAVDRIRDSMPETGMRLFSLFESAELSLAEMEVGEGSAAAGKAVSGLRLPGDCVLIALVRAGSASIIRGPTVMEAGDRVFVLARPASIEPMHRIMAGREP